MADREDFLKAFEAEPENYLHRYVFADWLDEHGEHEEADRQRKFEESDRWLRVLAADEGTDYEAIIGVPDESPPPEWLDDLEKRRAYCLHYSVVTGVALDPSDFDADPMPYLCSGCYEPGDFD